MTVTNYFIQEELKRRLNSGNACYHSVQNLLLKNVKIRVYRAIILPVVLDISFYILSILYGSFIVFSRSAILLPCS
jgi:hypothetical protein